MVENCPNVAPPSSPLWVPTEGRCSKATMARMGGPAGVGTRDEIGGKGATPVDSSGQGPGTTVTMIRDQGPWQSQQAGKPLEPGSHEGPVQAAQRLSVAEGVGRWAEELSFSSHQIHRGP